MAAADCAIYCRFTVLNSLSQQKQPKKLDTVLNVVLVTVFLLIFTWVSGCFVLWLKPLRRGHVASAER